MKRAIAKRIGTARTKSQQAPEPAADRLARIQPVVDRLYAGERHHTLREIAARHNISYWTVYRYFSQLQKKKPGSLLRFGGMPPGY
jgi:AraC-like DNA-binding protein